MSMERGVLAKAFVVLSTLGVNDRPQPLGVVTQQTGLNKPTVHRILKELITLGFVEHTGNGLYSLTGKLRRIADGQDYEQLVKVAEPHLDALHADTGETVNLGVLCGTRVAYLKVLETNHPLRRIEDPGMLYPYYSTALGRAIVAHLPKDNWKRMTTDIKLEAHTVNTITDPAKLRRVLQETLNDGYAIEREESDIGVMCLAYPIVIDDDVIAAVSITVPVARGEKIEKQLLKKLKKTVSLIKVDYAKK